MSKPRYDWWPYAKGMIRRYPQLKEKYADLHTQSITPAYAEQVGSGSVGRTIEDISLRELPTTEQREYEAVRKAIEITEHYNNGRDRLKVISLVLWKQTHTLEGAALQIPCSIRTAQEWHRQFIRLVASYYGLLDI